MTQYTIELKSQPTIEIQLSARGPQGPRGIQGEQGPIGPEGPAGPAGTTSWDGITDIPTDLVYDANYVHTDNNFTDIEQTKLSGIEDGAQVNLIETIQKNGVTITPIAKTVDILVPTAISELTNDSGYLLSSTASTIYTPMTRTLSINGTTLDLSADRSWTVVSGSGGFSSNIYFTTLDSDVSGYKVVSYTNDLTTTQLSNTLPSGRTLLRTYLFPLQVGITVINDGVWRFKYSTKVSNANGVTTIEAEVFARHADNTETTLFSVISYEINNLTYEDTFIESAQLAFNISSTDRLGVRVYGNTTSNSGIILSSQVGDGPGAYFSTPLPIRHTQLRDLNADVNYQHINATDRTNLNNLSGTNTGDQDLSDYRTKTEQLVAGEAVVSGNVCYLKSDGKYWKARANAEATTKGRIVIATQSISANATGTFLIEGNYTTSGLTVGSTYFINTSTAGEITSTIPTTGNFIRVVGNALSATVLYFSPSADYGEVS